MALAMAVLGLLIHRFCQSHVRASPQALKGLLPEREAPQLLGAKTLADRQVRHLAVRQTVD